MFTGTNRKSEGRPLSKLTATLGWVSPASSQAAGDGVGTKKVFKGRMESKEGERFSQEEVERSPVLSRCENESKTTGACGQTRFPIQTTKRQDIQGRGQGRQHLQVLAKSGSRQTTRGPASTNQLTENERKFSNQREKMWERMRKRKASAHQVVPALSAVKMRNKEPRGKTYR